MRQILQKECGEQDRQMTGWHKQKKSGLGSTVGVCHGSGDGKTDLE